MRRFISILLALLTVFSAYGTAEAAQPGYFSAADRDMDWADMSYVHYDPAGFLANVQRLSDLAAGGDGVSAMEMYDKLCAEFARIDTLSAIAYIRYSQDVTDEYWTAEKQYAGNLRRTAANTLAAACHTLTGGPSADAFAAHVGQTVFDAYVRYVPLTDRETQLMERESELVDEYYKRINEADAVTYTYQGESWDLAKLSGYQGANLVARDYYGYLEVFSGLHDAVSQTVGPVFLELVQIRTELARLHGWDDYASMMYAQTYGRDYTPADAQVLCDAVKEISPGVGKLLQGSRRRAAASPVQTPEQLLQLLGQYTARLDPWLAEPFQFLTEHGLCDLGQGDDRSPGTFTIALTQYGSAFIFSTPTGSCRDVSSLVHEFGHFVNDYYTPVPDVLASVGNYDLLEIHSTGLEALFTRFFDEIYGPQADDARYLLLGGLLEKLVDGCLFDEFQRRVYAQPDMTLEELNRLYADLSTQYGLFEPIDQDGTWVYTPHTFESPLYYLSYAASSLAAIQLWDMAQTDGQAAIEAWKAVLGHNAYEEGYMDVLPACGLRLFTEAGAVADICQPLLDELSRLNAGQ